MVQWSALLDVFIGAVMIVAGLLLLGGVPFVPGNTKYVFTDNKLQKECKDKLGITVKKSDKDKFEWSDYRGCFLEFVDQHGGDIIDKNGNGMTVKGDKATKLLEPFKQDGLIVVVIAWFLIGIGIIWFGGGIIRFAFIHGKHVQRENA